MKIGLGLSKLINEMAKEVTEDFVKGIDFSKEMIKEVRKTNSKFITEGKVTLHDEGCRKLPLW